MKLVKGMGGPCHCSFMRTNLFRN